MQKISKVCDLYSIGAIMFKLLMGRAPTATISLYIAENNLQEVSADANVYETPFFFDDFILSNDMCQILVKLLHYNPVHRFQNLSDLKVELLKLKDNIL